MAIKTKCPVCTDGVVSIGSDEQGTPITEQCSVCSGSGMIELYYLDDDDTINSILDKCTDILDKCNDIWGKVNV